MLIILAGSAEHVHDLRRDTAISVLFTFEKGHVIHMQGFSMNQAERMHANYMLRQSYDEAA